ncbi:MAG: hypothetical protein ACYCO9_03245 [Streptosporangiaceae bacterium]
MRRTTGLVSGLLLVLLGAWAGLAPFIAPYGGFGITPATPWHFDAGRLYFSVLPGAVVLIAGLIVAAGRLRPLAAGSALVAAIGGIWLGYGVVLTRALFPFRVAAAMLAHGTAIGATPARALLSAGALYYAPATLIVFAAALAVGRISVIAHQDHVRYAAAVAALTAAGPMPPAETGVRLLPGAGRAAEDANDAVGYQDDDYEQYGAIYERLGESPDPGSADPGETDPGETDPGETDPGETGPGETDPAETDPPGVARLTSGPLPPTGPEPGQDPDPAAHTESGSGRADAGSLAGQAGQGGQAD